MSVLAAFISHLNGDCVNLSLIKIIISFSDEGKNGDEGIGGRQKRTGQVLLFVFVSLVVFVFVSSVVFVFVS